VVVIFLTKRRKSCKITVNVVFQQRKKLQFSVGDREMKTIYMALLALSLVVVISVNSTAFGKASEQQGKSVTDEVMPKLKRDPSELMMKRADRILSRLRETDPEKAKELEELRKKDPEKFKAALKETIRTGFAKRSLAPNKKPQAGSDPNLVFRKSIWKGRSKDKLSDLMNRKHDEHLEWLKVNYPEEADKLSKLKDEQPEGYKRDIKLSMRKYGAIARASKDNPELAGILKESLELKEQRDKLLLKIKTSEDEVERKKLVRELKEVVKRNFAIVARRKKIKHQQLLKKLEDLQKEVKESKLELEKWNDTKFRDDQTKTHLEDLLKKKDFKIEIR